jgi:hypothetical protein
MIWLTWRQHRGGIIAGGALLGLLAVVLLATGAGMHARYDELGLAGCPPPVYVSCAARGIGVPELYRAVPTLLLPFLLLPALIGALWGAPLVAREVEQGTHRLVWTQSITRTRWLLAKVSLLALTALVALAGLGLLLSWWAAPAMTAVATSRMDPTMFDLVGIVPAAHVVGALAVGVAAGTFARRVVPAIAITLIAFALIRTGVEFGLRPHYEPPETAWVTPVATGPGVMPGEGLGWLVSRRTVSLDEHGQTTEVPSLVAACPEMIIPPGGAATIEACNRRVRVEVRYQPDDRWWRFQITEAGVYLVLSAALIGTSAWWIRHRLP